MIVLSILSKQQNQHQSHIMSHADGAEPHEEDDCEGCQQERAENNKLIQFYDRLHKIKAKVVEIRPGVQHHALASNSERVRLHNISEQILFPPNTSSDINNYDSKEIGYQLTCALLERQIKMKRQNAKMSQRIQQLKLAGQLLEKESRVKSQAKRDHEMQSETTGDLSSSKFQISQHRNTSSLSKHKHAYFDALDNAVEDCSKDFWDTSQTLPLRSEKLKKENYRYERQPRQNIIQGSTFTETGKSVFSPARTEEQKKPNTMSLNLWLYQFNSEQEFYLNDRKNYIKQRSKKGKLK